MGPFQVLRVLFLSAAVALFSAVGSDLSSELTEFDPKFRLDLLKQLRLTGEYDTTQVDPEIGIAIIDDDFGDEKLDQGAYPERYTVVAGYTSDSKAVGYHPDFLKKRGLPVDPELYPLLGPSLETSMDKRRPLAHGLAVAQSVLGVIGRHARVHFYFLNGDYQYNFAAAAYYAQDLYKKGLIRTVISSVNFTSAGMGNGEGPLDKIVSSVLRDDGLVWINAAGNDGGRVWSGKARRLNLSRYIHFRDGESGSCLRFTNNEHGNDIRVILVWDGAQAKLGEGTLVDYDVEVLDPRGRLILPDTGTLAGGADSAPRGSSGSQVQMLRDDAVAAQGAESAPPGHTIKPKEEIVLKNQPKTRNGSYCIRVRAESLEASEADDLQVILRTSNNMSLNKGKISQSVNFLDGNRVNELLPPATARGVVSVGNLAPHSSRADNIGGRALPTVVLEADTIYFANDESMQGTSFTAPLLAGLKVLLETVDPKIRRSDITAFLTDEPGPVTMNYVRRTHRNGDFLVNALVAQTTKNLPAGMPAVDESEMKAFLYPGGITIVTLPYYPGQYLNQFPFSEVNHQEDYDFFIGVGIRNRGRDFSSVAFPVAFSHYRCRRGRVSLERQRADGLSSHQLYPWESDRLQDAYLPYDTRRQRGRFEPEDFLMLQRERTLDSSEDGKASQYAQPDSHLRVGAPRDTPRKAFFRMPTQAEYWGRRRLN